MMSFESDLRHIIQNEFDRKDVQHDRNMDIVDLTARYCEMMNRRILQVPRRVHFSNEVYDSLRQLTQQTDAGNREKAQEAWDTTFLLYCLLSKGENVNGFLSKNIMHAMGSQSKDGLLWDFGMHHFHLRKDIQSSGFVSRSDYLLFAIITQDHAYFVDVRPHRDPQNRGWVRQDLLKIVHSNWIELIEANILRGVQGTVLTDEQKQELRRKNVNHIHNVGGDAVAPLAGGTMADGSSTLCKFVAMRLLHEIRRHQSHFDTQSSDLRSADEDKSIEKASGLEFELVLLDTLNPTDELMDLLRDDQCVSRDLCQMGFTVVERTTRLPVVVFLGEQD